MRKVSLLLVAVILTVANAGFIPAFANGISEWNFEYSNEKTEDCYGEIVEGSAIEGERSLSLYNNTTDTITGYSASTDALVAGEDYVLTFWIKGSYKPAALETGLRGESSTMSEPLSSRSFSTVERDGSWLKKSYSFTHSIEGAASFFVSLSDKYYSGAATVGLDDVIISDGDGNTVWSYGFEKPPIIGGTPEEYPQNVILDPDRIPGQLGISWVNAARSDIERVAIYDYDTDMLIASSDDSDITADAKGINSILIDYDNSSLKKYRLLTEFNDLTTEYIMSTGFGSYMQLTGGSGMNTTPSLSTNYPTDDLYKVDDGHLDNKGGYEGGTAYKLYKNIKSEVSSFYLNFLYNINLEAGKTYQWRYMTKAVNANSVATGVNWVWATTNSMQNSTAGQIGGTHDWKEISFQYTPKAAVTGRTLDFFLNGGTEALWIDNIEIYEIDPVTYEPLGENLVTNGDFESGYMAEATSEVSNLAAEAVSHSAEISWTAPVSNANGYTVYQIVEGERILKARIDSETTSVRFGNLINNHEYEYEVCCINASGLESEGERVVFTCEPLPLDVYGMKLTKGGVEVSNISESGEYTAEVTVENNSINELKGAELFIMYTDGGMIKASDFSAAELSGGENAVLSCSVNIEEATEDDVLKVFLWDSIEGMTFLSPMKVYE